MGLSEYARKRNFAKTPEPRGEKKKSSARGKLSYLIQKHAASRLHYDFRLEHDGVLLSWAVPKGPSLDPAQKRLAVHVEDHPLEYGKFEGTIPQGEYGGGTVMLWDRGSWTPDHDVDEGMRKGKLEFTLHGERLKGAWRLIRLSGPKSDGGKNWLLMKRTDDEASTKKEIVEREMRSVASGRAMDEIAGAKKGKQWNSKAKSSSTVKAKPARKKARALVAPRPGCARRARLPDFVEPQLATLAGAAPEGEEWIHEIKYDGYRMTARVKAGKTRWISRNGLDWTHRFDALSPAVNALPVKDALLDGEVVALSQDGVSDFQLLQKSLSEGTHDFTYVVFDLLHLNGYDLRGCPLSERKRALAEIVGDANGSVRYSAHIDGMGAAFHARACGAGLEGIVSKLASAPHRSGRTGDWIKTKCSLRQEFVVAGYTKPGGSRTGFGALVLGVHDGKKLIHAGRVGTGFDNELLSTLAARMRAMRVDSSPFHDPRVGGADVTWIEPRLVAEVAFTGWTSDGLLRHPRFEGLREDKPARDVVRERVMRRRGTAVSVRRTRQAPARRSKPRTGRVVEASSEDGGPRIAGVTITHPDRVLEESGTTKLDVARWYERVADRVLLHAADRPLAILRCPSGFGGACFFQKHSGAGLSSAVRTIEIEDSKGSSAYLYVNSAAGLLSLVQMNAVELHPWGSRVDKLERPDRICMDLDPAPDVPFVRVVEAAHILRDVLKKLDLVPFVKTTGGKGLHVVFPLLRRHSWDEVREFARMLATTLTAVEPKLYVDVASKARRAGRIFVDYLRNGRGATAVAAYSVRARARATIAMPLRWSELDKLPRADHFDISNVDERLKKVDPWADMDEHARVLPSPKRVKSR